MVFVAAAAIQLYNKDISIGFARETSIAPPIYVGKKTKFKVSLFNGTKLPVVLLTEECSWGYEAVSFELQSPAGKSYKITRKPKEWTRNSPTPQKVDVLGFQIRKVDFGDGTWEGIPTESSEKKFDWKLRATINIEPKEIFTKDNCWTGKLTSGWTAATLGDI